MHLTVTKLRLNLIIMPYYKLKLILKKNKRVCNRAINNTLISTNDISKVYLSSQYFKTSKTQSSVWKSLKNIFLSISPTRIITKFSTEHAELPWH